MKLQKSWTSVNITNIPQRLQKEKPNLVRVFRRFWETPLEEYAARLYNKPASPIEPELVSAFEEEWREAGLTESQTEGASRLLRTNPVIQTSHHITPTNGPRFSTIDLICLSGLSPSDCYLVGAYSGVAFSNPAWSGALSYGGLLISDILEKPSPAYSQTLRAAKERREHGKNEHRISLIPSRQRDQLLYGTKITPHQTNLYPSFTPKLQTILPQFQENTLYSHWAAKVCATLQNHTFARNNIAVFDMNQAIKRYLLKILESDGDHFIKRLFFDKNASERIWRAFGFPAPFLGCYRGKKSNKIERLFWQDNRLVGHRSHYRVDTTDDLCRLIREEPVCPGLFVVFLVLKFLNGIRCLGSFNQIEYMEEYRRIWHSLDLKQRLDVDPDTMHTLTTGQIMVGGESVWPLDYFVKEKRLSVSDFGSWPMKRFWEPIVNLLCQ